MTELELSLAKIQFMHRSDSNNYLPKSKDALQSVKKQISEHFRRCFDKIRKNFTCMVLLCVKSRHQQTKTVKMRAETVWRVDIRYFQCMFQKS